MTQSENINELAGALSKAQGEMQAALKDSQNPFFKSKYADLGNIWDACRPVLSKNALCIMQYVETVDNKPMLVTMLAHSSGQWMKSHLPLIISKNDAQGLGAAITYSRRYGLSALVGVVADDDDDGETAVGRGSNATQQKNAKPTNNQPVINKNVEENVNKIHNIEPKMSEKQIETLLQYLDKIDGACKGNMLKYMKDKYNTEYFKDLPNMEYERMLKAFEKNIRKTA